MADSHDSKAKRVGKGKGAARSDADRPEEKQDLNDRRKFVVKAATALGASLVLGTPLRAGATPTPAPAVNPNAKRLVATLQRDPTLVTELLNTADPNQRKDSFVRRGLLERGDHPTRPEIIQIMEELVLPQGGPVRGPGGRAVEWVSAIATAAAGAAAAACTPG
jgi:hypothetical protein